MTASRRRKGLRVALLAGLTALAGGVSACGKSDDPDLVAGKKLFVQKCGSCHILERAGTKGNVGPNLDAAFVRGKEDGFNDKSVEGVVRQQILHPSNAGKTEEQVGGVAGNGIMPNAEALDLEGDDVTDIAAYVAMAAGEGGKDSGLLASAVPAAGSGKPIAAKDGVLSIPADPSGQLAYVSKAATAEAGELEVASPNESGVPHNIVIDGKGEGAVVENGNSTFEASFTPGEYTFYCSVPGHREGGMEGKLDVK